MFNELFETVFRIAILTSLFGQDLRVPSHKSVTPEGQAGCWKGMLSQILARAPIQTRYFVIFVFVWFVFCSFSNQGVPRLTL